MNVRKEKDVLSCRRIVKDEIVFCGGIRFVQNTNIESEELMKLLPYRTYILFGHLNEKNCKPNTKK